MNLEYLWTAVTVVCRSVGVRRSRLTSVQYSCMGCVSLWFLETRPVKKQSWHMSKLKHLRHRYLSRGGPGTGQMSYSQSRTAGGPVQQTAQQGTNNTHSQPDSTGTPDSLDKSSRTCGNHKQTEKQR